MNHGLLWLYYILLVVVLVGGVYLTLLTLPGTWLMVLGTICYAFVTHFEYAEKYTLIAIVALAIVAELIDTMAAGAGAKKAGASKLGMWGAFLGGIAGGIFLTIPFPVIGTIIGICIGTFVGALVGEIVSGTQTGKTIYVAISAAWGRLMGILIKLLFSCVIMATVLWMAMPTHVADWFQHARVISVPTTGRT